LLRWHRDAARRSWTYLYGRVSRPAVPTELRRLVPQLAAENLTRGRPEVQGELAGLGWKVAVCCCVAGLGGAAAI